MLARLGRSESEIDTMLDNAIAFEALLVTCLTDMSPDTAEGEYTPEELSELAGSFPILDVLKSIDNYSDSLPHLSPHRTSFQKTRRLPLNISYP